MEGVVRAARRGRMVLKEIFRPLYTDRKEGKSDDGLESISQMSRFGMPGCRRRMTSSFFVKDLSEILAIVLLASPKMFSFAFHKTP